MAKGMKAMKAMRKGMKKAAKAMRKGMKRRAMKKKAAPEEGAQRGRKGCRRRLLCNPRPTPLSCTSATCKVCILLVAQSSTRRAKCTHKEHATCAEYSKCMY